MTGEPEEALDRRPWVYLGRRIISGDKLGQAWLDHNGTERLYGPAGHRSVGHTYLVECNPEGTRAATSHARPAPDQQAVTEDQVAGWRTDDRAAYLEDQVNKLERKARKDGTNLGAMTLEQVRAAMRTSRGHRGAYLAAVIDYLA